MARHGGRDRFDGLACRVLFRCVVDGTGFRQGAIAGRRRCKTMGVRAIVVIAMLLAQAGSFDAGGQGRPEASAYAQAAALLRQGKTTEAEGVLKADLCDHPQDVRELDLLGTILDAQERFEDAEAVYSHALRIEPNSPSLLNNLGNHYAIRGQLESARTAYLRVVGIDPHHANANLHLAQMSAAQNDGRKALAYLDNLLEPDRSSPTAQLLRAQALRLCGEPAVAVAVLEQLEKQASQNLPVMFSVGLNYADWGQYDQAETVFTKISARDPTDVDVLYNLGLAAMHAGHLNRAEEVFGAVLKQRPNDVDTLVELARVHTAQGQDQRTVELLTKAHLLAPGRPEILFTLAEVEEKQGSYADSAKALEEYRKLQPNDPVAERELAFALAHTGQFDRGLAQLMTYVDAYPQDPLAFYELALAESVGGRERALEHLNQAIALDPNLLPARYARAVLNCEARENGEAAKDLTFILAKNPNDYAALDLLGVARVALNQDQEALSCFRHAAELASSDARVQMHYSRALLRAGQIGESKTVMRKLGELPRGYGPIRLFASAGARRDEPADSIGNPDRAAPPESKGADGKVRRAEMQLAKGKTGKALAGCNDISEHTTDATSLAACSKALLEKQQFAEARKLLEKAVARPNSPPNVRLDLALAISHTTGPEPALASLEQTPLAERGGDWYLLAAQLLISSGRYTDAMAYLNRGLDASPTRPDLFFDAARLLLNYGTARSHYNEAADFLEKARRLFPADPKLALSQAILYALLGRPEDAEKTLAETELRWPDWARPYLVNGIILVNYARLAEARALLAAAIGLGDADPLAYLNLALVDMNSSPPDVEGAQAAISQASRLEPHDPYVEWLAGKVSYAREDYQGAIEHLHTALKAWPDMVEAHMQLSATYRALGEKAKSVAELQEVARIKQSRRGVRATPPLTPSMQNLLTAVPSPP